MFPYGFKGETGWIVLFIVVSYLFASFQSSFSPLAIVMCGRSGNGFPNYLITLQLALLLCLTRWLYVFVSNISNEKWKLAMLPLIVFAFPVSVVILWMQLMGCR